MRKTKASICVEFVIMAKIVLLCLVIFSFLLIRVKIEQQLFIANDEAAKEATLFVSALFDKEKQKNHLLRKIILRQKFKSILLSKLNANSFDELSYIETAPRISIKTKKHSLVFDTSFSVKLPLINKLVPYENIKFSTIAAIRDAKKLFTKEQNPFGKNNIAITRNGFKNTHVYHVKNCIALRASILSKNKIFNLDKITRLSNDRVEINGKIYSKCPFCNK